MNIGPGGISFRKPQITGPQMQGPQMKGMNLDANSLKMPGKGGANVARRAARCCPPRASSARRRGCRGGWSRS